MAPPPSRQPAVPDIDATPASTAKGGPGAAAPVVIVLLLLVAAVLGFYWRRRRRIRKSAQSLTGLDAATLTSITAVEVKHTCEEVTHARASSSGGARAQGVVVAPIGVAETATPHDTALEVTCSNSSSSNSFFSSSPAASSSTTVASTVASKSLTSLQTSSRLKDKAAEESVSVARARAQAVAASRTLSTSSPTHVASMDDSKCLTSVQGSAPPKDKVTRQSRISAARARAQAGASPNQKMEVAGGNEGASAMVNASSSGLVRGEGQTDAHGVGDVRIEDDDDAYQAGHGSPDTEAAAVEAPWVPSTFMLQSLQTIEVSTPGIEQSAAARARIAEHKQRMMVSAPIIQTPGVQVTAEQQARMQSQRKRMLAVAAATRVQKPSCDPRGKQDQTAGPPSGATTSAALARAAGAASVDAEQSVDVQSSRPRRSHFSQRGGRMITSSNSGQDAQSSARALNFTIDGDAPIGLTSDELKALNALKEKAAVDTDPRSATQANASMQNVHSTCSQSAATHSGVARQQAPHQMSSTRRPNKSIKQETQTTVAAAPVRQLVPAVNTANGGSSMKIDGDRPIGMSEEEFQILMALRRSVEEECDEELNSPSSPHAPPMLVLPGTSSCDDEDDYGKATSEVMAAANSYAQKSPTAEQRL